METYSEQDLDELEARFPEGISSGEIIASLDQLGVRFSEASLRKWVQFELLPRSVRVGHKGQQKGSLGQYPASIVRRILEVKGLLGNGYSIEQIRSGYLLLRSEVDALEQQLGEVLGRVERTIDSPEDRTLPAEQRRRELREVRALGVALVERLRALEARAEDGLLKKARATG